MGIQSKIEEIRQKPEHIRVRYVWVCTAVSMVFVLAIWFVSLYSERKEDEIPKISEEQMKTLDELSEQGKSLKDAAGAVGGLLKNQPSQGAAQNIQGDLPTEEGFVK